MVNTVGDQRVSLRTPLYDDHKRLHAKLVDFAGWEMPIVYSSITAEHQATRSAVGLFDISHMGRLRFTGGGATAFLERMLTNSVESLKPGRVRYSLVLNERGNALDDVLLYADRDEYLLVVNASNREKLLAWFTNSMSSFDVGMIDETLSSAMIAVQGPRALDLVQSLVPARLRDMPYYSFQKSTHGAESALVSRTGYTGEDGFEIVVSADHGPKLWNDLLAKGQSSGIEPVGLGARDTLRLEAGMPLYGHELTEEIDPIQARLSWAVKKTEFVGQAGLREKSPDRPVRVGLTMSDKRIAREGYAVWASGGQVGIVTSGTFSPSLAAPIAMAYIDPKWSAIGTTVSVRVREADAPAQVVGLPFYKRRK